MRHLVLISSMISLVFFSACDKKADQSSNSKIAGNLRVLTTDERAADFDQLLQMFKAYYGPYQLKEQTLGINIEKTANDLKAQAMNAQTDEEFMGYVMQFGAALKDGHVQFAIENSASNVSRYRIPIVLASVEDKALVADIDDQLSEYFGISRGDEILSVDGKTPQQWMAMALKYRSTARTLSDKQTIINSTFGRRSFMTDLIPTEPLAEVKFMNADGETATVSIPWTKAKYNPDLDFMITPKNSLVNLSVPYLSDMNLVDGHAGQMGQVEPVIFHLRVCPTLESSKTSIGTDNQRDCCPSRH